MVKSLTGLALLLVATPLAAQTTVGPGETLLQIQTVGEATTRPDLATISIGVVSTGTTAREATDANATQMAAVVAALRKAGVEARYLRTQQINVQPRFARNSPSDYEGQAQITGYVARNSVGVTIVELAKAPDIIAAGFGAGANSVNGPYLALRDNASALAAARRDALAKARVEADAYADGLGMKVVRVLRLSERGNAAAPDLFVSANSIRAVGSPPSPAPMSAGEMHERATLWIDYALAPK